MYSQSEIKVFKGNAVLSSPRLYTLQDYGLGLLCLMPPSTIFQLYRDGHLIVGGNHQHVASH